MRIRRHGNGLAIALAGLAVVLAMTGTAVAVTASVVQISDPVTPANKARVNASGQLAVSATVGGVVAQRPTPPTSVFNVGFYIGVGRTSFLGPTNATLAVTRVAVSNPRTNASFSNTNFAVSLIRITPGSDGTCYSGTSGGLLSKDNLPVGAQAVDSYGDTPLVFKPSGTQKYCVGLYILTEAADPSSYYLPFGQLTGYVVSGTFTSPNPLVRTGSVKADPAHPHPAGTPPRS